MSDDSPTIAETGNVFDELVALLGEEGAKTVCRVKGGRRLYVSKAPSEKNTIVRDLGIEIATKLAEQYGGETLLIPMGDNAGQKRMRRQIRRCLREGKSWSETAAIVGCQVRTVQRVAVAASSNKETT